MPTTLLVPNVRTQSVKFSTNFNQVVKSIMMLAILGQKRQIGKNLLRDLHSKDFPLDKYKSVFDSKSGQLKENQIKMTTKSLTLT